MQPETTIEQTPQVDQPVNHSDGIAAKGVAVNPQATEQETQQQINWKKFREERVIERKQLEEQKRAAEEQRKKAEEKAAEAQALKEAMDAILNKPTSNGFDADVEDEEKRIERLVENKFQERQKREEQDRRAREAQELPQKLVSQHNDFNDVCSTENLDYLTFHFPEVAAAYKSLPDSFDKWSNLYKAVKRFVPNTNSKRDEMRAEKNFNKPQSASTAGVTQQGSNIPVRNLDEQKKAANWERMQRTLKGLS